MSITKVELAKQLGISRRALYDCIELGCPTDSVESAKEWRQLNLHPGMSKEGRLFGNDGGHPKKEPKPQIQQDTAEYMLRNVIPKIWFEEPGWLGLALKDVGIEVNAEQVYKAQVNLLNMYMQEVDDYFEEEATFNIGPIMMLNPEDEAYPSLTESLNQILED